MKPFLFVLALFYLLISIGYWLPVVSAFFGGN